MNCPDSAYTLTGHGIIRTPDTSSGPSCNILLHAGTGKGLHITVLDKYSPPGRSIAQCDETLHIYHTTSPPCPSARKEGSFIWKETIIVHIETQTLTLANVILEYKGRKGL